jgi:hypothetical protein
VADSDVSPVFASVAAVLAGQEGWRVTLALTLAKDLDRQPNASVARELRTLMHELAEDAPAEETSVPDQLRARRAKRVADSKAG